MPFISEHSRQPKAHAILLKKNNLQSETHLINMLQVQHKITRSLSHKKVGCQAFALGYTLKTHFCLIEKESKGIKAPTSEGDGSPDALKYITPNSSQGRYPTKK